MSKVLGSDRGITVTAQDLYEQSTTQMHKLGERLVRDERIFRYAKAVLTAPIAGRACCTTTNNTETANAAATTVHDVGNYTVTITVQAAAGLAVDELAGGYLCHGHFYRYKIVSHPAADSAATCVLTLETPITGATITIDSTAVTAFGSMWKVQKATGNPGLYSSFAGMAPEGITVNSYFWLQTWGPVLMCPANYIGAAGGVRTVVFAVDGSITDIDAGTIAAQRAGTLIPDAYIANTAATNFDDSSHLVNLQIMP